MGSIVGLLGSIGSLDLAAMFRVSRFLKNAAMLCSCGTIVTGTPYFTLT